MANVEIGQRIRARGTHNTKPFVVEGIVERFGHSDLVFIVQDDASRFAVFGCEIVDPKTGTYKDIGGDGEPIFDDLPPMLSTEN